MLAKLFIHPIDSDREKLIVSELEKIGLNFPHPDLLFFSLENKLGIDNIKTIKDFLKLKPYTASNKIIAIVSSHDFSEAAQNSLLKSLEEPAGEALFILGASSDTNILPTILSRCEVINLTRIKNVENKDLILLEKLIIQTIPERFRTIENTKDKESFLENLIIFFRGRLHKNPENLQIIKSILKAEQYAKQNGNMRAILEYLMLTLPRDAN